MASILVIEFGAFNPRPPHGLSPTIWIFSLWGLLALYGFLLWGTMRVPEEAELPKTRRFYVLWSVWIGITTFCWLSGNWTLVPFKTFEHFDLNQQAFVFFTLLGQVLTVIFLMPSRAATLSSIAVGFSIPLFLLVLPELRAANPKLAPEWFIGHIAIYLVIAWFAGGSERRQYARAVLQDAERSRGNTLLAAISHDLRQPLATLALKLSNMEDETTEQGSSTTPPPQLLSDIRVLQQQVYAMETMINGTLDLSRLEAGTWVVQPREVALPQLIDTVVADLQADAAQKRIALEVRSLPYLVMTDPTAFGEFLRNLVGNALRYTPAPAPGREGLVLIECEVRKSMMRVSELIEASAYHHPKWRTSSESMCSSEILNETEVKG